MAAQFDPDDDLHEQLVRLAIPVVARVVHEVAEDARRLVPVDTGELKESISEVPPTDRPYGRVEVGDLETGLGDYWASVEYGSGPHDIWSHGIWIRPERPWPLRNAETGEVFGLHVHHPGTPAQPFLRPALYVRRRLS